MRDIGVRYSHRQSYGLELLSSCYYYGRPIIQGQAPNQINNNEIFEQKVFASRRLFIAGNNDHSNTSVKNNGGLLAGINDKITTNSHPETTFYNLMDVKPTGYLNFKNWKEWLSTSLNLQANLFVTKDFKGMLAFDKTKATNSNGTAIGEAKFFWDSEWNINNISGNYNVDMSSNFKYKDPDTNLIIGSPTVDYSKISQKYMSAILNFNSVVFSSLIQMPYDSVQWLPFALSDIPLIGKLLNVLSLGIPIGFIINQNNQQYKKMLYFNGFMSAFFTNNLENIIGNGGLIPLNAFANENAFAIGKLLGANISTTAMTMKLTDRISVYPWDPKTGHKLKTKEQISTVDLSQKKNNKVYILAEDTEFLNIASPLTNLDTEMQWNPTSNGVSEGSNYAYIIDTIVTQSLHQGEERHTFYSDNPFTYQGDYNELSIAQFRYKNKGALTSNAFNWTTLYKLNHDEYKETEETTFSYPANILPPSPQNIAKQIVIIPSNPTYTADLPLEKIFDINSTSDYSMRYAPYNWNNFVEPKIKPLEIDLDIKSLLDPTLLIKNFEDLQRYYKSIDIYISWNYKTSKHTNTTSTYPDFYTSQTFSEKEYTHTFPYDLKDLLYYSNNKELLVDNDNYNINKYDNDLSHTWKGIATMGKHVNNKDNLYILNEKPINVSATEDHNGTIYNKQYNSNILLGFKNLDNSRLKFILQLFPTYLYSMANRTGRHPNSQHEDLWYIENTDSYSISITKIVLNVR
ncbi:hypothetical protein [Spiroplasma endosymbiont of Nebria brevicollis]|uniref:hypothetical protein n=1 Tax=Spiroplasma endosymbiont of Nebria brevicollis TaxID=3066284 RepID=UPI00313CA6B9